MGLGTINFCFQALVEKGLVKMQNFSQSKNKLRYAYLLTFTGGGPEVETYGGVSEAQSGGV